VAAATESNKKSRLLNNLIVLLNAMYKMLISHSNDEKQIKYVIGNTELKYVCEACQVSKRAPMRNSQFDFGN